MSRDARLSGAILALTLLAALVSLLAGRVWIAPATLWHAVWLPGPHLATLIVTDLRLPRTVLALVVGSALGLSGAVLQGVTRNPLAEPGLLGVSAGAALGAVIAIYFGLARSFALAAPLAGLAGALGASLLTFAIGRGGGTIALILAGAAVSGLAAAGIALALNLAPNPYAVDEITTWLLGSLADRSWFDVLMVLPFLLGGGVLLALTARSIDALALGEAQAASLGVNLHRVFGLAVFGTALAVGASTAVTGVIGFIGLVAPHLVRPFVGYQPSRVMLPATLLGGLLLLLADIATRLVRFGPELRVGVFTSLIGTPFFFWLVVRLRKAAP